MMMRLKKLASLQEPAETDQNITAFPRMHHCRRSNYRCHRIVFRNRNRDLCSHRRRLRVMCKVFNLKDTSVSRPIEAVTLTDFESQQSTTLSTQNRIRQMKKLVERVTKVSEHLSVAASIVKWYCNMGTSVNQDEDLVICFDVTVKDDVSIMASISSVVPADGEVHETTSYNTSKNKSTRCCNKSQYVRTAVAKK